jgi:hypothetical protein
MVFFGFGGLEFFNGRIFEVKVLEIFFVNFRNSSGLMWFFVCFTDSIAKNHLENF